MVAIDIEVGELSKWPPLVGVVVALPYPLLLLPLLLLPGPELEPELSPDTDPEPDDPMAMAIAAVSMTACILLAAKR